MMKSGNIITFGGYRESENVGDIVVLDTTNNVLDEHVPITSINSFASRFAHAACSGSSEETFVIFGGVNANIDLGDIIMLTVH